MTTSVNNTYNSTEEKTLIFTMENGKLCLEGMYFGQFIVGYHNDLVSEYKKVSIVSIHFTNFIEFLSINYIMKLPKAWQTQFANIAVNFIDTYEKLIKKKKINNLVY